MIHIVKNKVPYDVIVDTVRCVEEACWLAHNQKKTIGSKRGDSHTDIRYAGYRISEYTGATIPNIKYVTVHEDWILIDADTNEVIPIDKNSQNIWHLSHMWEKHTAKVAKNPQSFEERFALELHQRRHGHKKCAWSTHHSFKSWHHNTISEMAYADDDVPAISKKALRRNSGHWDMYWYTKTSKCWKDQSKRKHQHYRLADMTCV